MGEAFRRSCIIEVATAPVLPGVPAVTGLRVQMLACKFMAKADISESPNMCELEMVNVNPEHRAQIQEAAGSDKGCLVRITAGYQDDTGELFAGYCNQIETWHEGQDWTTRLSIADGAEEEEEHPKKKGKKVCKKLDLKLNRGMPVTLALAQVVKACGFELAAVTAAMPVTLRSGAPILGYPMHLKGNKVKALAQFANGTNLTWSVQAGIFEGSLAGLPFNPNGPLLSSNGTLYSARLTPKGDLQFRCALDHRIRVGTAIVIDGAAVKGAFTVDSVEHSGSTEAGGEWITSGTGLPF